MSECSSSEEQFVSSYILVDKSNDEKRFISENIWDLVLMEDFMNLIVFPLGRVQNLLFYKNNEASCSMTHTERNPISCAD